MYTNTTLSKDFDTSAVWREAMFVKHAHEFADLLDQLTPATNFNQTLEEMTSHAALMGRILDLGCGSGRYTNVLAEKATAVYGIDFSNKLLELANIRYQNVLDIKTKDIQFILGDMRSLSAHISGDFTLFVRLYTSLGYFNDNEELEILKQCRGLAESNAYLVLDTFNGEFFKQRSDAHISFKSTPSLTIREQYQFDSNRNMIECQWHYMPLTSAEFTINFFLHNYDIYKIKEMLEESGWLFTRAYSDYGAPITEQMCRNSNRLVIVARAN
jgi:SAM-dependent methyltransferase